MTASQTQPDVIPPPRYGHRPIVGKLLALGGLLIGGLVILGVLSAFAWFVRPDTESPSVSYTDKEIARAKADRNVSFDPDNPIVVHVDVPQGDLDKVAAVWGDGQKPPPPEKVKDLVATGALPKWFPRGESPVLEKLVDEGSLPPVAERVGPQPVVLRSVDAVPGMKPYYGGTWLRAETAPQGVDRFIWQTLDCGLFLWSPQGYPLRPHLAAKPLESLNDGREFILTIRKGIRYSDGHEVDTDDIMFWWHYEVLNGVNRNSPPAWMVPGGKRGTITKLDKYRVKFTFEEPYGLFPEILACSGDILHSPKHYLGPLHPGLRRPEDRANPNDETEIVGEKDKIEAGMKRLGVSNAEAMYGLLNNLNNPEMPVLRPWMLRRVQSVPPIVLVRNPFYYVVDEEGNQLPYVDQVMNIVKMSKMMPQTIAGGKTSFQDLEVRFKDYTELMNRSRTNGYKVLHWYDGTRSQFVITPNLNRVVPKDDPHIAWKAKLLADKRFRRALSLAIDRQQCIRANWKGLGEPSQVSPGKASPFRHDRSAEAAIEPDLDKARKEANALLDEVWRKLGADPSHRDAEGFRTTDSKNKLLFYLDFCENTGIGPSEFIVEDWKEIGLRVVPRNRARSLFVWDKNAANFDMNIYFSGCEFMPLLSPRMYIPVTAGTYFATRWGRWYNTGGFWAEQEAEQARTSPESPSAKSKAKQDDLALPVPKYDPDDPGQEHPMRKAIRAYEAARQAATAEERKRLFDQVLDIAAEQVWSIGIATAPPKLVVVKDGFKGVPQKALYGDVFATPGNLAPETFYFEHEKDRTHDVGTETRLLDHIRKPKQMGETSSDDSASGGGAILRSLLLAVLAVLLVLVVLRHPYIARRLVIMVPTLLVISISAFIIIQLPPGDFLTARLTQLEEMGTDSKDAQKQIEQLEDYFHFDDPPWKQYCRWMGFYYFVDLYTGQERDDIYSTWQEALAQAEKDDKPAPPKPNLYFKPANEGLLQGNLGRPMETPEKKINDIVGDRITLTFFISLGTILFTWAVAIPIGIYSAVRQYSVGDYALTFIGFVGMCVPGFLLALVLAAVTDIEGLFSAEFVTQAHWNLPKVIDLLKHIWIPVIVMGVTGTAGMIRVMRANLLDELRKPYVITAMAKGVRPAKLLFKYPVRLALNPFISTIGGIFPRLVSGGAIVAIVLSLPTVGPLMLKALFAQDMYMAGSMLMMLSLLGVLGTLVSDMMLLWLDPRIRFKGGSR